MVCQEENQKYFEKIEKKIWKQTKADTPRAAGKDEQMTVDELRECWWRRSKIKSLQDRIERINEQITSAAAKPLTHAPRSGGNRDAIGEAVAKMQDLRADLLRELVALEEHLRTVERWLDTLPPNKAAVLRLRYVDGYSWREVARRAGYAERHCRRIETEIRQALQDVR